MDLTILELNTLSDALHILHGYGLIQPCVIDLLLHERGVRELTGQITVIRDEDDSRSIAVKTTDRIDTLFASTLDEIHHRTTAFGVVARGYTVLRLIKKDIDLALSRDAHTLIYDLVKTGNT